MTIDKLSNCKSSIDKKLMDDVVNTINILPTCIGKTCINDNSKYSSKVLTTTHPKNVKKQVRRKILYKDEMYEETPMKQAIYTYICYFILNIFGLLRDFLRKLGIERRKGAADNNGPVINIFFFSFRLTLTFKLIIIIGFCSIVSKL